jgi:peptidoglycan/xylan/chitin deacetylase (PgdA/CDA1 family)
MYNFYLAIFFFLFPLSLMSVDIAITLDDYPMADGLLFSAQKRTEAILKACSQHNYKVAFFCIGQNCTKEESEALLSTINNSGHFLANHSMTHTHFSEQTMEELETELRGTEAILATYPNMRRWFRYPFLDYGNRTALGGSDDKALRALDMLSQTGYVAGYVTINTFDWYFDIKLQAALAQGVIIDYKALKTVYLGLLKEWIHYYNLQYEARTSEKIVHTLLLHANDLNALYLQDILKMIEDSGWNIVSPEMAFADISLSKKVIQLEVVIEKPPTLNYEEIDNQLKTNQLF